MTNSKHSLSAQKQYYVSVSPKFPYEQTPLSACGRIEKTCKIARHGYVDCVRASGLPVFDTDMLVDALRGFSAGLDYVEEAEQQGALRISITTEMELIVGCRNRRELHRLERFLRRFTIMGMTEAIAARAVTLLRQHRLS